MDRVIKSLSEILSISHSEISDLLKLSKHNINESSSYGTLIHSTISTFEIISSPIQTSKLNALTPEQKNEILKSVLLIYPIQERAPEITEITFKADPLLSQNTEFIQYINDEELINDISIAFNLLERKPPKFWIDYKSNSNDILLEDYYRSEFFRMLGMKYQVGSEEESKIGRTDLTLKSTSLNRKIFEFKIWKRNDYLNTSSQLLKYLTEIDDSGFIIMGNNRKSKDITESEYKPVITNCLEYINNSLKSKMTKHGFKYYEAVYNFNGKSKKIYHFILNLK